MKREGWITVNRWQHNPPPDEMKLDNFEVTVRVHDHLQRVLLTYDFPHMSVIDFECHIPNPKTECHAYLTCLGNLCGAGKAASKHRREIIWYSLKGRPGITPALFGLETE